MLQSGRCNQALRSKNKEAGWSDVNYLLDVLDHSFEVRQICSKLKLIQYGTVAHVHVQLLSAILAICILVLFVRVQVPTHVSI